MEMLHKDSFSDIALILLKVGGFFLVNKIGIRAAEVITETKIKGWKFWGLLKLSKNIPTTHSTIKYNHVNR